jgi:nitrogen fixation/metabolism regulation signal transduction histidine kinase
MTKSAKRDYFARGKGVLSATGPQSRFILFLIFLLVAYTLLLRIFQKLAAIVELPVFLPIALITLLAFIGIAGTLYSHRFVGPMVRIRKTLEHVAKGDCAVTLRLRDSDDPMLKDLVQTIGHLCEQSRHTNQAILNAARDLSSELAALRESIQHGASGGALLVQLESIRRKEAALEDAVKSLGT